MVSLIVPLTWYLLSESCSIFSKLSTIPCSLLASEEELLIWLKSSWNKNNTIVTESYQNLTTVIISLYYNKNPCLRTYSGLMPKKTTIKHLGLQLNYDTKFNKECVFELANMYRIIIRLQYIIHNGNRTEWSPIRSVIIREITKSDDSEAGVRFVNHEYDYRLDWTTRCPVTN